MIRKEIRHHFFTKFLLIVTVFSFMMPEFFKFLPNYGYFLIGLQVVSISFFTFIGNINQSDIVNLKYFILLVIVDSLFFIIHGVYNNYGTMLLFKQLLNNLLPYLSAFSIYAFVNNKEDLKLVIRVLLLLICFQLFFGAIEIIMGNADFAERLFPYLKTMKEETVGKISSRNIVGKILGFSGYSNFLYGAQYSSVLYAHFIIFAPLVFLSDKISKIKNKTSSPITNFLLVSSIIIMYFTFMRGPLLGILVMSFMLLLKYQYNGQKSFLFITIVVLSFLLFGYYFGSTFMEYINETQHFNSRFSYWVGYIESFRNFDLVSIFGGTHEYSEFAEEYGRAAHNSFIIFLIDKGILFIIFFINLLKKILKIRLKDNLLIGVKFSIGAFLISQLFDNNLATAKLIQFYFFAYCLLVLSESKYEKKHNFNKKNV